MKSASLSRACFHSACVRIHEPYPMGRVVDGLFLRLLQNKENKSHPAYKRKVKPHFYGEALTIDMYQWLAEKQRQRN